MNVLDFTNNEITYERFYNVLGNIPGSQSLGGMKTAEREPMNERAYFKSLNSIIGKSNWGGC